MSRRGLVALLSVLLPAAALGAVGCSSGSTQPPLTIRLTAHYSKFLPSALEVPRGRAIRFVIRNADPIDHEWILGDDAVQEAHEQGTEAHHAARPTEVSVDALSEVTTTVTFAERGTLTFACHLPGHFAYGMRGELRVR